MVGNKKTAKVLILNRLTATFPVDPCAFLKKHLAKELLNLYAESEKRKQEMMVRVCFDDRSVFLERVKGTVSKEDIPGGASHFDVTEPPWVCRRGRFLTTVHTHIPYATPKVGFSSEEGLCNMSKDDMDAAIEHGSCFFIYPKGRMVRIRGAWIVGEEPKMADIKIGKKA